MTQVATGLTEALMMDHLYNLFKKHYEGPYWMRSRLRVHFAVLLNVPSDKVDIYNLELYQLHQLNDIYWGDHN